MAQVNINIRMDEKLKKQFDSVESDPFYSEVNQARLRKSIADLNAGKGKVHELIEVADK